jgi:hypothetical protein
MATQKYRYQPRIGRVAFMLWLKPEEGARGFKVRRMLKFYKALHNKQTMFDALEELVDSGLKAKGLDKVIENVEQK